MSSRIKNRRAARKAFQWAIWMILLRDIKNRPGEVIKKMRPEQREALRYLKSADVQDRIK